MIKSIFALLYILLSLYSNTYAHEKRDILLLNSYHQDMPWVKDITKGVLDTLEVKRNNLIVHIENMDTKRHNNSEYYASLATLYKDKYTHIKFDLILSSDNNALDFLKKYKNKTFGEDVPVSFCGINNFKPSLLQGYKNYTGVSESLSEIENIELILKLHPNVKEVYVLNDYLKSGRAQQNRIQQKLKPYEKRINITYSKNQTIKELQTTIKNLPQGTIVLMGGYFADKNQNYFSYEKISKILSEISPVPVYCMIYYNLLDGVIGGKVISGYYQGSMMANLGLEILNGAKVEDIDIITNDANRFIFNNKALERYNIDIEKLPKESIIINDDEEFIYEKFGLIINLFLIVLSILIAAVIAIYFYKKNLKSEKTVVRLLVFGPIIFIPTIFSILVYSILLNHEDTHQENIDNLIEQNRKFQKNITKNEVEKLASMSYIFKHDKEKFFEYINSARYSKNGYFFALDKEGRILAHGNNQKMIGQNIFHLKDKEEFYFIKEMISNALSKSNEFIKYKWEYPLSGKEELKYSYTKFLPHYNIVIGSGIYEKDIELSAAEKIAKLDEHNQEHMLYILSVSSAIIVIFTVFSIILANMMRKILEKYNIQINNKNRHLEKLNFFLEEKIKDEIKRNEEKDNMLFQQSKMAVMGEMLDNIAHQWRQPLSMITLNASAIKTHKEFGFLDKNKEFRMLDDIVNTGKYLSHTIDDFRGFLSDNKQKSDFTIRDVVKKTEFLLQSILKQGNINVIDNSGNITIHGIENELVQVFMNLICNAKDAFSDEKENRYILIELVENNHKHTIFEIKDNAGGIKKDIIDHVFDQRFTTKGETGGSGIGLYMSKQIIEKSFNGKISVFNSEFTYNSLDCKGAVFRICLNKE